MVLSFSLSEGEQLLFPLIAASKQTADLGRMKTIPAISRSSSHHHVRRVHVLMEAVAVEWVRVGSVTHARAKHTDNISTSQL